MAIKNEEISKLKVGNYVIFDGKACKIVEMQKSAPGKHGHAKYRVAATDLMTGHKIIKIMTGHASVEVPIIEKKPAQVLSVSGKTAQIMDLETYETFDAEIDPSVSDVKGNDQVIYWDILGRKIIKGKK